MSKNRTPTYQLTDHICRKQGCQGRILVQVSPSYATGGGNPLYRCADCGASTSAMGPSALCWCGTHFKGQPEAGYFCVRKDSILENPWMRDAMMHCGFDPDLATGEIGVVHRDSAKIAEERFYEQKNISL